MSQAIESSPAVWTAVDLVGRFGAIPLNRVRTNPPPGSATERNVIEIHDRENRLCELVDGSLLEKTMSSFESYLAVRIAHLLTVFVEAAQLGIVWGRTECCACARAAADPQRLFHLLGPAARPRFPARGHLDPRPGPCRGGHQPRQHAGGNGAQAARLLHGRRAAGVVRLSRRAQRFTSTPPPTTALCSADKMRIDGGGVLAGFRLPLETLFAQPGEGGLAP